MFLSWGRQGVLGQDRCAPTFPMHPQSLLASPAVPERQLTVKNIIVRDQESKMRKGKGLCLLCCRTQSSAQKATIFIGSAVPALKDPSGLTEGEHEWGH